MELNQQIDLTLSAQDVLEILSLLNNGRFDIPGAAVERFSVLKMKLNCLAKELQEVKEPQKEDSSKEEELQEEMGDIEK